ncbi:MAG: sigma-54-dependent Fis family transcriptional regulator, partial [Bacillota bacterium]
MKEPTWAEAALSELKRLQKKIVDIKREWENFVNTGKVQSDNIISAEVLSSWIRCRNRGLNPYNIPIVSLTTNGLRQRLEENSEIIKVATPFLRALTESVEGSGFRVDLFDPEIFLLASFGDKDVLLNACKRGLTPGANRSEINAGTTAMNLALLLEKPVQLLGPEHYNVELHNWTCAAVPIKGENGKIIAIINATGNYSLIHKHTLGMVIASGKSIEYILAQKQISNELEITNRYNKEIIESISDALIVVNANGELLTANQAAKRLLGVKEKNLIGYTAETLWGPQNPFDEVLATREPIVDQEIILNTWGKKVRVIGTVRPIISAKTGIHSAIGTFKGMQRATGFVKNLVGWKAHFTFENLIGDSMEFRQAVHLAQETAKMPSNVLIQGESGTGKELFAQAIHNASPFRDGPFVGINCSAIPKGLLESELFGYEEGAFTGARKGGQPGKIELAEGGTIFFDEINSLPLDMQAKLLRTLQNKTITRVGGKAEISVSVRVITASNADLWQMVRSGDFREDLFYRINVINIVIPPLRERYEDIEPLVKHIVHHLAGRLGVDIAIDKSALAVMKQYHWPGNVRELENVLERSFVLAKSKNSSVITETDIINYPGIMNSLRNKVNLIPVNSISNNSKKALEKEAIENALIASNGNITQAAQILGIARITIYRKMKRYGLQNYIA